ncbi:hypothetical protein BDL97_02G102900 [Sphagnum fallax]|nr:hypothetical protein BDL97_02G102900 [Sphagnum fallax]
MELPAAAIHGVFQRNGLPICGISQFQAGQQEKAIQLNTLIPVHLVAEREDGEAPHDSDRVYIRPLSLEEVEDSIGVVQDVKLEVQQEMAGQEANTEIHDPLSEIRVEEVVVDVVELGHATHAGPMRFVSPNPCPVEGDKPRDPEDLSKPPFTDSNQEQPDKHSVYIYVERQTSIKESPAQADNETSSLTLLSYLRIGWRLIAILVGLAVYTLLLLPGFIQVCYYYYSSKSVHRNIVCGDHRRNRLDLHLPGKIDEPKPVVIFVTGGAWIIGHRAWGSLFGKQLAQHGIIVASLDYRNYPHGTASNMVADICSGIAYVRANIASYGGDPEQLFLVGQSAGAHLSACALVSQAKKESEGDGTVLPWKASQFKAYMGISGGC